MYLRETNGPATYESDPEGFAAKMRDGLRYDPKKDRFVTVENFNESYPDGLN